MVFPATPKQMRRRRRRNISKIDVPRARKGFKETLKRTRRAGARVQKGIEKAEQRRRKIQPRIERLAERADTLADRIQKEGGFTGFGKSRPVTRKKEQFFGRSTATTRRLKKLERQREEGFGDIF